MDPILYWNDVALEANRISHTNGKNEQTGPTLSSRALAIVHLAMYDAYVGIGPAPGLTPYLPAGAYPGPEAGASVNAAVAAAAHATLSALFPSQRAFFDRKHTEAGLSGGGLPAGHQFGLGVAQAILKDRKDDPSASDAGYAPSMARGAHRPDPDNPDQGYHGPFYGMAKLFSAKKRHDLDRPPMPGEDPYTAALIQVRRRGIAPELMGTLPNDVPQRTVDQTLIGIYWGYDGAVGLGTPPRLYNQIVRKVAIKQNKGTASNAHLFALVNVAMADSGILAWAEKYRHNLWRPVVGIREHDPSMGPAGVAGNDIDNNCDTGWLPLGAPATNATTREQTPSMSAYPCSHTITSMAKNSTPPFPAYPSGHATFGAAAFQIVRFFYGDSNQDTDNLFDDLDLVSDEFNGVSRDNKGTVRPRHVRKFPDGLWQMIVENGLSRVYLGVHWVFDAFLLKDNKPDLSKNVGGVPLGLKIAEDIFQNSANGVNKSEV